MSTPPHSSVRPSQPSQALSPTLWSALVLALAWPAAAAAQVTAGPADDVESIINGLSAGDELILDGGMYSLSGRFGVAIAGTEAAPIVIRAADGATPHFHRPDASQNIWDLDVAHVVIRGLEFSGGSAGLRVEAANGLTIEGCDIHDTADVALRMNDSGQDYRGVQILRNHIHDTDGTGEGMYLGCNSNGCRLVEALIANNHVHHTNRGSVSQGDGIEVKEGSYGNIIRDNVIHDTNYPCILTYGTVGNGPANVIERNVMWNCGDHGIQSAADATIRNNVILGAGSDGIALQPHQAATPANLTVVHNTIINASNNAISLRNPSGSVVIANNALFAQSGEAILMRSPTAEVVSVGNAGQGAGTGVSPATLGDLISADYSGAPPVDACPTPGGSLIDAGEAAHVPADDFNGVPRMGAAHIGAYAHGAGDSPGWIITDDFKELTGGGVPGTDGGVPSPDGGAPGTDGGTPGTDGGPGRDGSAPPADGGTRDGGAGGTEDSGCGCRTAPSADSVPSLALVAFVLLALRRRRAPPRSR